MVQLMWKTVWWSLKKVNIELPYDPPFPSGYVPAAAKSLQSCPTLSNPRDGSPPGSPVPGILQARVLEWGAIAFSEICT